MRKAKPCNPICVNYASGGKFNLAQLKLKLKKKQEAVMRTTDRSENS